MYFWEHFAQWPIDMIAENNFAVPTKMAANGRLWRHANEQYQNKACSFKAKHFDFQYGDDDGAFGIYSKRKKNWTVLV